MPRRNLNVLLAGIAIGLVCYSRAERNPYARYASGAFRLVDDLALQEPPDDELFAGAVRGMVAVLRRRGDEHSAYLEPQSAEPLRAEMAQEFGGVGVRLAVEGDPPRVVIVEPPQPGTPAYTSGIRVRDVIVAVNGEPIAGLALEEVVARMRGPAGEALELTVRHSDGRQEAFRLVREVIRIPSVVGDRPRRDGGWEFLLEDAPEVALVRLTTFGNHTGEEFARALDAATTAGARGAVLDLRGNAGGAVDAAIAVCELLLPAGAEIVSTRGRDGEELERFEAADDGPHAGLPLAVIIDGDTASASEIVAAALQDHGRAVVVGERSFGKGTVQQLLPLEAGRSLLKLTSASYWRPSGANIHRLASTPESAPWGVSPDPGREVPLTDDDRRAWWDWRRERDLVTPEGPAPDAAKPLAADLALAAAVDSLREGLAAGR